MLKIVVTGYNSSTFLKKCLDSIKMQKYTDYQCVVINDASTEKEYAICAKEYPFEYIENSENLGPLGSRIVGIDFLKCQDDDIIFLIDGDDWLLHDNVFQFIVDTYNNEDVLLTWGNWFAIDTSGNQRSREKGLDSVFMPRMKYVDDNRKHLLETNTYREAPFSFSHPRTFKYILWRNINPDDFLNKDGNVFRHGTDFAFMYPMIEMCGDRFKIIYERLYAYNLHDNNEMQKSQNDMSQNRQCCRYIIQKKKYKPLIISKP